MLLYWYLLQLPFIDSKFYKGQIAEMLGGVDLSWLVGLLSTAVLYYVLAKRAQIKISKALQLERVKYQLRRDIKV